MDTFHTCASQVGTSGQNWDNVAQNDRGQYFHGVSNTCQQSLMEQGDIPSSPLRMTKLEIQILLNDVKQSINHMQGNLNTMQGQCIELQTAISKIIPAADVAAQSCAKNTANIPKQRKGILLKASVSVKNGDNPPQPPPIIPKVAQLWKWDGGVCTPPVDFYSKRRDVRLRYVVHPAMMPITKPEHSEHSEANPQYQTGSRMVADPKTPAVQKNSGGWLGWVFGRGNVHKKEVNLPEDKDKSIVWDTTLHRWVDKTELKAENRFVPPTPLMGTYGYQGNTGRVPKGVNPYSMKAGLWGNRYLTMHYTDGTNSKPPSHGPGPLPRQLSGLLPPSHFDLMAPMVVPPDTLPY